MDYDKETGLPLIFGMPVKGGGVITLSATVVFQALFGTCCTVCSLRVPRHCSRNASTKAIVDTSLAAVSRANLQGKNERYLSGLIERLNTNYFLFRVCSLECGQTRVPTGVCGPN